MSHLSWNDPILQGAARALFVQAYASQQEERYARGKTNAKMAGPGEDWVDVAPPTPRDAVIAAAMLLAKVECANKEPVHTLLWRAWMADEKRAGRPGVWESPGDAEYERNFGHYIAMQAVGHGVSWFDDHAEFELVIPHTEFYL